MKIKVSRSETLPCSRPIMAEDLRSVVKINCLDILPPFCWRSPKMQTVYVRQPNNLNNFETCSN